MTGFPFRSTFRSTAKATVHRSVRRPAVLQVERLNDEVTAVVVIFQANRKVVIDLFYLHSLPKTGRTTLSWAGSALEDNGEKPTFLAYFQSKEDALDYLTVHYDVGQVGRRRAGQV